MEMPENRRDQLVMGLSICALILLVANIATFVKQRFLEDQHEVHHAFVVSGVGSNGSSLCGEAQADHQWHVNHENGNEIWAITDQDVECLRERADRFNEEIQAHLRTREMAIGRARDGHRRLDRRRARFAWRLHGDHVDGSQDQDVDRLLEEALEAAESLERQLGLDEIEMPRLQVESLGDKVDVIESQDEAGRHRYRIVVKPNSDRQ